jgi:glc operon protein GlcG
MFKKTLFVACMLYSIAASCMASQEVMQDKTDLMIQKAVSKAQELGINISVAIVDAHGNLKAFKRMDGAALASIKLSQGKAYTSAAIPAPTGDLAEINAKTPGYVLGNIPGFVLLKGGMPILNETGEPSGAIGVGGGSGEQDEQCAMAAIN